MISKGFLPAWTDANEIWPGVCQSCVITTFAKPFAIRLITGMTCSPSLTARLPPGRKQFWTSITSRAEASSILIEAAAQACLEMTTALAVEARPARMRLRSGMLHLPCKSKASKSLREASVKKLARRGVGEACVDASLRARQKYPPHPPICLARLNSVAHGAETWKRFHPFLARRASDNAQRVRSSEFQPLHYGDGGIVLAAGRIDASLIAGQAVDADRFGHRDPRVAHTRDRRRGLLSEPAAILRQSRRRSDQPDHHEGGRLETGYFITVGENDRSARRQRADIFEIAEFADLERHQSKLLLVRNLLADHRRGKHLPHRIVGIDFGGILGNLHGDVAGERAARQNHRVAPHRGRAILGVLGGVVGKAGRCLDAFRLDAAAACRVGLEGIHDFAIGLGRQLGYQDLDALVLGFESDE